MEKITVVNDGTVASRILYEKLVERLEKEKILAQVRNFAIECETNSGLSNSNGIKEYKGKISSLAKNIGDSSMLLIHLAPVSQEVIEADPYLKYVGSERSSLVNIDLQSARQHGITVCFAPGRNVRTVAEFTIGLILSLARRISEADSLVKRGDWTTSFDRKPFTGIELENKTLGIIGMGNIGKEVNDLLSGFGMKVLFYDPFVSSDYNGARCVDLHELIQESDIITIHARDTGEGALLSQKEFESMKQGVLLINTSRGCLVDQKALIAQLLSGHLGGAALDVYEEEPLPQDSPLLKMHNVILTPHLGGLSKDMEPRSAKMVVDDVIHFLKGEPLERRAQL